MDKLFFPHSYLYKRNQCALWSGYDSEQLWHENINDVNKKQMLEESGWLKTSQSISYQYNDHAFRDEDFDDRICGIALGCSFTEGVGVAASHTWPSQLSEILGVKVWNLGIGGTGIDTCFRVMEFWAPVLKPRFIALLDPPIARLEICRADGGYTNLLNIGWEYSDATSPRDQFVKHWFAQERNWIEHHRRHVLAMRMLAQDLSIPFVHLFNGPICQPVPNFYQDPRFFRYDGLDLLDRARDLAHVGPRTLHMVAEVMQEKLREVSAI